MKEEISFDFSNTYDLDIRKFVNIIFPTDKRRKVALDILLAIKKKGKLKRYNISKIRDNLEERGFQTMVTVVLNKLKSLGLLEYVDCGYRFSKNFSMCIENLKEFWGKFSGEKNNVA